MPGLNDLATTHPDLAKQWHPTLNGDLQPSDVTAHSSVRKVWWLQEYDDPKTGHHEFVWSSTVYNRAILGAGCPYLSCDVWTGYNDLQTTYPRIASQWHPTKNQIGPDQVSAFSTKVVWWIMPYDDPQYGHFDFEWQATIASRTKGGNGCPYLSGAKVWKGFNDLVTTHPDIAKQWHPSLNGKNRPEEYSAGSNEIVWWYLPYDDPKYGHFDFEWKASIYSRALRNENCPYLTGYAVWPGFNDLKTTHPELAKQWHPTKNKLTPEMVSYGSKENVWWYLPYDDPKYGHFDFEWRVSIYSRVYNNSGCPYLDGKRVWSGYNDLATIYPEIAAQWHPTKNGDLTPDRISCSSDRNVWWYLPYDDPVYGHFDFEWTSAVGYRTYSYSGCPYLDGFRCWPGYNDLVTVYPEVAAQWHPTKNGELTPDKVFCRSSMLVWWLLPYDDPKTGNHYDFEWIAPVNHQTVDKAGCPFIRGYGIWSGYNDLKTTHPEIAKEWNVDRNKTKRVDSISASSTEKAWWICEEGHEWYMSINYRVRTGAICPACRKAKRGIFIT